MSTALMDADVLCYKAAAVAQFSVDWEGDGEWDTLVNRGMALGVVDDLVEKWRKAAKCKRVRLVFSDRTTPTANFRYHIYHAYKGNRTVARPRLHDDVKAHLEDKYPSTFVRGLEGDDVLGLMGTGPNANKYVVVTIDKDLLTVPCRQVNPDHDDPRVRRVLPYEADLWWMTATLTGDAVDNIKGCPQVGDKRAMLALAGARTLADMWARVLEAYGAAHHNRKLRRFFHVNGVDMTPYDLALMNAHCTRILRAGDHNRATGEVRLWSPDGEHRWIKPF